MLLISSILISLIAIAIVNEKYSSAEEIELIPIPVEEKTSENKR